MTLEEARELRSELCNLENRLHLTPLERRFIHFNSLRLRIGYNNMDPENYLLYIDFTDNLFMILFPEMEDHIIYRIYTTIVE